MQSLSFKVTLLGCVTFEKLPEEIGENGLLSEPEFPGAPNVLIQDLEARGT